MVGIREAPPEVVVRALFTKEALADYLRVSVYTVKRLVQDGVLTAIKVAPQVWSRRRHLCITRRR